MIPIIPHIPPPIVRVPLVIPPSRNHESKPLDKSDFISIGVILAILVAFFAVLMHPITFYYFDKYVEWSVSINKKWRDEDERKRKDRDKNL